MKIVLIAPTSSSKTVRIPDLVITCETPGSSLSAVRYPAELARRRS